MTANTLTRQNRELWGMVSRERTQQHGGASESNRDLTWKTSGGRNKFWKLSIQRYCLWFLSLCECTASEKGWISSAVIPPNVAFSSTSASLPWQSATTITTGAMRPAAKAKATVMRRFSLACPGSAEMCRRPWGWLSTCRVRLISCDGGECVWAWGSLTDVSHSVLPYLLWHSPINFLRWFCHLKWLTVTEARSGRKPWEEGVRQRRIHPRSCALCIVLIIQSLKFETLDPVKFSV